MRVAAILTAWGTAGGKDAPCNTLAASRATPWRTARPNGQASAAALIQALNIPLLGDFLRFPRLRRDFTRCSREYPCSLRAVANGPCLMPPGFLVGLNVTHCPSAMLLGRMQCASLETFAAVLAAH